MTQQAATTATDAAPRPRLLFDEGTILIEGLAEGDDLGLPGVQFDPRAGMYRAEAIRYREIVERLGWTGRSPGSTTRAYDKSQMDLPGHQGSLPASDRRARRLVEGHRGEAGSSSCRPAPARRTWPTSPSSGAGRPSLVVTPTIDLMNQWYDELSLRLRRRGGHVSAAARTTSGR